MNKKAVLCVIMLAVMLSLTSGCASIFCGTTKAVNIKSTPDGAQFSIMSKKGDVITKGTTPTIVTLKRGRGYFAAGDYTISMDKPGYKSVKMPIKQGVEWGWYGIGNCIFGGLIGILIVDPLTGGMYNIEDVNVNMTTEGTAMLQEGKIPLCYAPQSPKTLILRQ